MPEIAADIATLLLWGLVGYGLGSIPFGILIARAFGLGNLRDIGSGNIGATNVLRTGSKAAAALTLLLDGGKGAAAVLLARAMVGEDAAQIAGLAAFVGHCFPIWLGFRGGKGVATFLGLFLAVNPLLGLTCLLTWLVVAALLRFSSLAALASVASAPVWMMVLGDTSALVLSFVVTVLVYWRHAGNIARLRAGTEPRIGQKG